MDGIFNPLITRNFIRLWQPFFLAALAGSGLVGLPISLRLAWSAATYSPFLSAHFVHNCKGGLFFCMVIRQRSLALAFCLLFSLSLSLPPPLLPPLVCRCRCLRANFLWLAAESRVDVERGVHDDYTVECEDGSLSHPLLSHSR